MTCSTVANFGTCTYTPAAGFTGTDTFTYTIEDEGDLTDTATVTITVQPNEGTGCRRRRLHRHSDAGRTLQVLSNDPIRRATA